MTTRIEINAAECRRGDVAGGSNGSTWTERLKEAARLERIKGNRARLDSLLLRFPESPEDASSLALEILEALFKEIKSPETFWHKGALIHGIRLGGGSLTVFIQGQKETDRLVLLFPEKKENQGFCLCEELKPFRTSDGKQGYDEKRGYLVKDVRKGHREVFGNATNEEKKTLLEMAASAILRELGIEQPSAAN